MILSSLRSINLSLDYGFFWPLIAFLLSILVSYVCYPAIIRVSKVKRLMPKPNHRSVHKVRTPNLGGIGVFIAINLIITFLGNYFEDDNLLSILGAITILFFTGLIDDLIDMKAKHKLLSQVLTTLAIVLLTNLRIHNFHGILGIYELPYFVSIILTVLGYVLIINAYNLIDGVDGLAGTYAIAITSFFGIFYFFNGNDSMFFLSICIVGALISFLFFNFSTKEKIFMGDTGSMVIGFLLAYQAFGFLSVEFNPVFLIQSTKAPIFILALFTFPFLDTIRVFVIRILNKKNPLTADRNHIHHVFLDSGLKHWKISVIVSALSMFTVLGMFVFNELSINKQLIFLVGLWGAFIVFVRNMKLLNNIKQGVQATQFTEDVLTEKKEHDGEEHRGKRIVMRDMA
jgi:UDP-N-acetylmuramyl pentapeptide phosphotransferase/UDP-N-acetylglucosamine-1-phosphate transferase